MDLRRWEWRDGVSRRLEDRIRTLCLKAVNTPESEEFRHIVEELRHALHEHVQRFWMVAFQPERRKASSGSNQEDLGSPGK